MKKFLNSLMNFLRINTPESSTRLFTLIIIATSMLSILSIIIVFIILLFKDRTELEQMVNMVISLGGIAIAALTGKVFSTNIGAKNKEKLPEDKSNY